MGVIMYRHLLLEQTRIVEDGGVPMNTFRDPSQNRMVMLPFDGQDEERNVQVTNEDMYGYGRSTSARVSTGSSGKFKTLHLERAKKAGATMPPPFPPSAKTVSEVSPG